MNWAVFQFQGVWQDLLQGSQDLLYIWSAESSEAFVPSLWLTGSSQGVVLASQTQKSLSDICDMSLSDVTPFALALTLGRVVSLLDLIIWVQYLQEFVLSEWMLELMESKKADI